MPSIYDFTNYREYLKSWIEHQPNRGRGLKGQFARTLNVSSTLISFILSGQKELSLEQASDLADFLGLNEPQTDYLFMLVEHARAGHHRLQEKIIRQIRKQQEAGKKVSARVTKDKELSPTEQATFYSSWIYSGIRNLAATAEFRDAGSIAKRLNLPVGTVQKALQFLLESRLCVEKKGRIEIGPGYTHIDADSPLVNKHRQNWRLRGIQQMDLRSEKDLFYVCPMSLSAKDAEKIRRLLLATIEEALKVMRPSESETVHCLNIDWFEF